MSLAKQPHCAQNPGSLNESDRLPTTIHLWHTFNDAHSGRSFLSGNRRPNKQAAASLRKLAKQDSPSESGMRTGYIRYRNAVVLSVRVDRKFAEGEEFRNQVWGNDSFRVCCTAFKPANVQGFGPRT